jgi:beta-galactosidase
MLTIMSKRLRLFLSLIAILLTLPAQAREVVDLSDGWRFRFGDVPDQARGQSFDDGEWEEISVPHTWNRIGEYALERGPENNNAQGTGWYRLWVDAPVAAKDMRQYLDFAAVGNIADVWVNGLHVGQHKGAFSRFRLDVTDAWQPGKKNLVAVRADNSKPAVGSSTEHVIPLAGDFFIHGGIYRQAALVQLPAASIDPLDFGGPGIYARAAQIADDRAVIAVLARLRNFASPRPVTLNLMVRDADGNIIAHADESLTLGPGKREVQQLVTLHHPRRWNGRDDPYLYTVTAILRDADGVLDEVTQPLGIRSFRFDPEEGFFLNGEHVKLKGVSRHQDRLGKGWALSAEDHAEDMALIAEMGANSVRQGHYQHADEWTDEADKAGMVVWAELPYVGAPSLTGGKGSAELWANAEQQLRELIRQNYNHPSIMMWSIGNEVDSAKAFGAVEDPPSPIDLLRRLHEVAKEEDPDRPTVFADFSEDFGPFGETRQPMTGVADLIAYNRYFGWYYLPGPMAGQALGGAMDKLHAKHPTVPMGISEYGAGSGLAQFSDDPMSGFVASAGRPQSEEYAALVHEWTWPVIAGRDYIYGSWVWNMFDFVSDLRNEGDSVDINTKGLISMDRKVKKDAFWFYKATWSEEPMIHLAGKRYIERSYPVMDVKAYTNAAKASLFINGGEIGEVDCPNHTCVWKGVRLVPGENRAEVRADGVSDSTVWSGPDPAANGIRIDAGNIAASQLGGKRYGSDTFVTGGKPVARFAGAIGSRSSENLPVAADVPELFDHWRAGESFSYAVPAPDGDWMVTIHTLEPGETKVDPMMTAAFGIAAEGYRPVVMSVSANGEKRIEALDAAKAAGGMRKAIARSFPVTVEGGVLELEFAGVEGGSAAVAAIEITK